jgi:hypothetical protein
MITLHNSFNCKPDDPGLSELLALRKLQIQRLDGIRLIIFNLNDSLESLNEALGFDILTNHWTGERYTEIGFSPSWEYLETHTNWLEVAYLYNDNEGALLFIQKPLPESLKSLFNLI